MKILGTFIAAFALSLTFALAQTTTTTSTTAAPSVEKKACCKGAEAGKSCCKGEAKDHADAAQAKPVVAVSEETVTTRTPGGNGRRVTPKSNKKASMKPEAAKE